MQKTREGKRQRISLARAFLKNAPIVVLDEPTSSVDMKTETVIIGGDDPTDAWAHHLHYRPPPQYPGQV